MKAKKSYSMPISILFTKDHEAGMTFLGFLVLFDPVKSSIAETIADLHRLGVSLKIITGDNRLVAAHVGQQVGLLDSGILTGPDLRHQKERIILALKKAKNVVGYMGDGINDASALHTADVGISVDSAVDVAKDAADIVLLEKDLGVLVQGVGKGGRLLPIPSSMYSWRLAPISAICSAWRKHLFFSLFFLSCPSKSCLLIC
jgi:Mg2+-importing ATPase